MTNKTQLGAVVLALATTFGFSAPASAAFITIDDRNVNSVTISAGDFEGGFFVNGDLLTTGLGNSGSVTLADGGFTISGSWIDEGGADEASPQRCEVGLIGIRGDGEGGDHAGDLL